MPRGEPPATPEDPILDKLGVPVMRTSSAIDRRRALGLLALGAYQGLEQ